MAIKKEMFARSLAAEMVERDCFGGRGCFAGGNQVFMVYHFENGARFDE